MADKHFLGEFTSLTAVWKMFPNGGGYGDWVTINGVRHDWDESTNSWGDDPGDVDPALPEIVNHDIDVQGTVTARDGIQTADYIPGHAGAFIDHAGDAEFRSVDVDSLRVQHPITEEMVPLPEFIKLFKTELPPDWSEYEQIIQFDNVRILAFDPLTQDKFYTTIGALKKLISDSIAAGIPGGTLEVEILRSDSLEDVPTDNNVFSALRTLSELYAMKTTLYGNYLSKTHPDIAQEIITFLKGAHFGEFSRGMFTGTGGGIDGLGNAEFESLKVRSILEVPELRYNRLTYVGDEIAVGAGGIIEEVRQNLDPVSGEPTDPNVFFLKMKLEDGEFIPFAEFDIIKGIYNQAGGFHTSWFRVDAVDTIHEEMTITLGADEAVPGGKNYPPQPFMNIARRGNFVNPERQSTIIISAKDGQIVMLDGVDNYMGGFKSFQLGKPTGLEHIPNISGLPIDQQQGYLYARGLLVQDLFHVDYEGKLLRTERDRGMWSAETAETDPYRFTDLLQDAVWMPNGKYLCIVDGTLEKPEIGSTDWIRVVIIKDEEYSGKNKTYFSKPSSYTRGDTWFLTKDEMVNGIFYRRGTMLHAAYETGFESDWRQVIYEPDSTSHVNNIRNYDLRFPGFLYWGGAGESIDVPVADLPTEFYKTGFNIIEDEIGFNYPVHDEQGNEIEL